MMSRLENQTLLSNNDQEDPAYDSPLEPTKSHESSTNSSLNLYTILAISCACVGGLMFGYDTGCVSQILELLKDDLGHSLHAWELELITSSTSVFALIGSIFTGISADKFGRKTLIGISCVIFIIAALVMALANSLLSLVFGRSLVGLAVGGASTIVTIYIAEISPPNHRGRLVALNSVSTTGGQVLAYLSGVAFYHVPHGWRYILGLSGIPPALFLLIMAIIPESPRYLIMKGRIDEAKQVLFRLDPSADVAAIEEMIERHAVSKGIEESSSNTNRSAFIRLFTIPSNFRALIVGCGLMASQQLCCFNGFMYFSVSLFAMAGFNNPVVVSLIVSITNFAFTWVAVKYVDKIGRRAILLRTVWIMVVALIVVAYAFNTTDTPKLLTVIATIVFVAAYATGMGNIPWQAIEFLPLDVRSLGSMFISSTNWACNTLVSASFLSLLKWISPAGTFLLYASFTFLAYIGIYLYYPEVAGLPLEEVNDIFKQGWKGLGRRRVLN